MKKIKNNSFFTFIFSFLPGGVEMYTGFFKSGISLMSIFFILAIMPSILGVRYLSFACGIVWFFSFFHARSIAKCTQEELNELRDKYIWDEFRTEDFPLIPNKKLKKWGAISCIIVGVLALYENVRELLTPLLPAWFMNIASESLVYLPKIILSILIIILGIRLILGKKEEEIND